MEKIKKAADSGNPGKIAELLTHENVVKLNQYNAAMKARGNFIDQVRSQLPELESLPDETISSIFFEGKTADQINKKLQELGINTQINKDKAWHPFNL